MLSHKLYLWHQQNEKKNKKKKNIADKYFGGNTLHHYDIGYVI